MTDTPDPFHVPSAGERPAPAERIALGAARLGIPRERPRPEDLVDEGTGRALLAAARELGVQTVHTAAQHGNAPDLVGLWADDAWNPQVVTRIPRIRHDADGDAVARAVRMTGLGAMVRNDQRRLYGILTPDAQELLGPHGEAIWRALQDVGSEGLAERVGTVIHSRGEWLELTERFQPDLVIAPLSPLDQRLLMDGTLAEMDAAGVEVHGEHPLQQGLLLHPEAPSGYESWQPALTWFHRLCQEHGVAPLVAAIRLGVCQPNLHRLAVGVISPDQLREVVAAAAETFDPGPFLGTNPHSVPLWSP